MARAKHTSREASRCLSGPASSTVKKGFRLTPTRAADGRTFARYSVAMRTTVIALTALLLMAASLAATWAQTVSGPELRGRIEQMTDSELVVRGEDGRLHFVDTAAMPSAELGVLTPGDEVAITIKDETARGPIGRSVHRKPGASPRP